MERLRRLHRLAILRGDLLAIAVLEGRMAAMWRKGRVSIYETTVYAGGEPLYRWRNEWTETEMRAAWGDR